MEDNLKCGRFVYKKNLNDIVRYISKCSMSTMLAFQSRHFTFYFIDIFFGIRCAVILSMFFSLRSHLLSAHSGELVLYPFPRRKIICRASFFFIPRTNQLIFNWHRLRAGTNTRLIDAINTRLILFISVHVK